MTAKSRPWLPNCSPPATSYAFAVGDETYTLKLDLPDEDRPSADEVERSIAGIERAAGSWKDEDTDAFLDYIYHRRSMPPRPAVKL